MFIALFQVLQNLAHTYQCLDVFGGSLDDDAQIGLSPCSAPNTPPSAQWQPSVVPVVSISVNHSRKCLVPTANNLAVTQQTCIQRAANLTGSQFWVMSAEQIVSKI